MKLKPANLLWLFVLIPAIPFALGPYLDNASTFSDTKAGKTPVSGWLQKSRIDFSPVSNQPYQTECGSCHFAFQPGLLPQRSWKKIMSELDNHFGDSAELEAAVNQTILNYLTTHSAENSTALRSQHLSESLKATETPIRITDTLYFRRKHNEIPDQLVKGNPATGSFSNCDTCHRHANQGLYNEQDVLIPSKSLTASTM